MKKRYNLFGTLYTIEELRAGYEIITGIPYNDTTYDKPLTDEEIYNYLLEALK